MPVFINADFFKLTKILPTIINADFFTDNVPRFLNQDQKAEIRPNIKK